MQVYKHISIVDTHLKQQQAQRVVFVVISGIGKCRGVGSDIIVAIVILG